MRSKLALIVGLCLLSGIAFVGSKSFADDAAAPTTQPATPPLPPTVDATGHWHWTLEFNDNSIDMGAQLTQDGNKLTGVFIDGFDQAHINIKNGQVSGDQVSFTVQREVNDNTIIANYSGKLSGGSIKGNIDVHFGDNDPNTIPWEAKPGDMPATAPSTDPS